MTINITKLTVEQLKMLQHDIYAVLANAAAIEAQEQERLKANNIRVKLHELSEIRKKIYNLAQQATDIVDEFPELGEFSLSFGDFEYTYDSDNGWSSSY